MAHLGSYHLEKITFGSLPLGKQPLRKYILNHTSFEKGFVMPLRIENLSGKMETLLKIGDHSNQGLYNRNPKHIVHKMCTAVVQKEYNKLVFFGGKSQDSRNEIESLPQTTTSLQPCGVNL